MTALYNFKRFAEIPGTCVFLLRIFISFCSTVLENDNTLVTATAKYTIIVKINLNLNRTRWIISPVQAFQGNIIITKIHNLFI